MKHSFSNLTVLILLLFCLAVHSQNRQQANSIQLEPSRSTETVLKFNIDKYDFKSVNSVRGTVKELVAPNTYEILKKGAPALPKQTASIAVSETNQMQVDVINSKYVEIHDVTIAPSKGSLPRSINPKDVPYTFGKEYSENRFYPSELVEMTEP
ncbi:MAG: hypothetical protein MI922_18795, partial [Bacteroidales bacterium]|nr:hypothetical protein [Bacteroidales bacterium]